MKDGFCHVCKERITSFPFVSLGVANEVDDHPNAAIYKDLLMIHIECFKNAAGEDWFESLPAPCVHEFKEWKPGIDACVKCRRNKQNTGAYESKLQEAWDKAVKNRDARASG